MKKGKPHIWEYQTRKCYTLLFKKKKKKKKKETTALLWHKSWWQQRQLVPPRARRLHAEVKLWRSARVKLHLWHTLWVFVTRLTYHGWFDEAPGVALRYVGLKDARRAPGLVHASEHVHLPSAHRGGRGVDRLGKRWDRLPLVCDGIVPGGQKRKIVIYRAAL